MKGLTIVLLVLVVALAASTGYLGYQVATEPTKTEVLDDLTWDEIATEVVGDLTWDELSTMKAFTPVSGFSIADVVGEIGGENFVDDLDRKVSIDSAVERIVCLNPAATEMIFDLGIDSKLVAVSDSWSGNAFAPDPVESWIETPEDIDNEIEARVSAGELTALNAFSVGAEAILDLEPDVVFAFGYTLPAYAEDLQDIVPVFCFSPTTLADVLENLVVIGRIVGKETEANNMVEAIKAGIADIASLTVDKSKPKVFCEINYYGGIYTTGNDSFLSSLIILAGGEDIGTAVSSDNAIISEEYIVDSQPEIIILLDTPWETAVTVEGRSGWNTIPAVTNGKIYEATTEDRDLIQRSGPRIVEGLKVLLGIIHPELSE
jgi:iron complex transport system substrate-binding protein